jgi:hypothetical protein
MNQTDHVSQIRRNGYTIVPDVIPRAAIDGVATHLRELASAAPLGDDAFSGYRTRRVYNLLAKTRALDPYIAEGRVVETAREVLDCPVQLGQDVLVSIGPGEVAQGLHYDAGIYPLPRTWPEIFLTAIIALDDFTAANGGTRIVPGSHLQEEFSIASSELMRPRTVAVEMTRGSALLMSGKLIHGGGANTTSVDRLGCIVDYIAGWIRPAENHTLAVPVDLVRKLPKPLQELLGYGQYSTLLGFVDGRVPLAWLHDGDHGATAASTGPPSPPSGSPAS